MKKTIHFLSAILCGLVALTACEKDPIAEVDDPVPEEIEEDTTIAGASLFCSFELSGDTFSMLDITVEYLEPDGSVVVESITEDHPNWEREFTSDKLPVTLGARLMAAPKEGADFKSIDKFVLGFRQQYSAYLLNKSGQKVGDGAGFLESTSSTFYIPERVVDSYLVGEAADGLCEHVVRFEANGERVLSYWSNLQ